MSANQRDWAKLLDVAQFSYNLLRSGRSPFEILMGQQPCTPNTIATGYKGSSPAAYKFAKGWEEQQESARACLEKAAKRMKKWAEKKRSPREFQEGDLVLVKLYMHGKGSRGQHQGLLRRYEGPYPIVKRIGKQAYKVDLPPNFKMHPVFHVSLLKPFLEDKDDPSRSLSTRAPGGVRTQYDKEIEEIISDRVVRHLNKAPTRELLVKWKGLPDSEASWEPLEDLWQFREQISAYEDSKATRTPLEWVGENVAYRKPSTIQSLTLNS